MFPPRTSVGLQYGKILLTLVWVHWLIPNRLWLLWNWATIDWATQERSISPVPYHRIEWDMASFRQVESSFALDIDHAQLEIQRNHRSRSSVFGWCAEKEHRESKSSVSCQSSPVHLSDPDQLGCRMQCYSSSDDASFSRTLCKHGCKDMTLFFLLIIDDTEKKHQWYIHRHREITHVLITTARMQRNQSLFSKIWDQLTVKFMITWISPCDERPSFAGSLTHSLNRPSSNTCLSFTLPLPMESRPTISAS